MLKELREKLDNLPENYAKDIDIVALKALCTVPEAEEIVAHVKELVEKLETKYVNDDDIKNLIPKDEMTLEKLVGLLEEKYATNIDFITLKAMMNLEDSIEKEKAIKIYLNKINTEDEDIKQYLEDNAKKKKINSDMVFVEGGFFNGIPLLDLYVSKYQVVQEVWEKIMGDNPSTFKGGRKPVENITWWKALEFCNKLSIKEGLEPVYKLKEDDFKVIHLDGEEVYPYLADFSKTEGYRLPTELEWEWFATGGVKTDTYTASNSIDEVAWNYLNTHKTHDVGLKKMNELGLYDCLGNVFEWCYDARNNKEKRSYDEYFNYETTTKNRVIKGGSWACFEHILIGITKRSYCEVFSELTNNAYEGNLIYDSGLSGDKTYPGVIGFRVVKTANPKY